MPEVVKPSPKRPGGVKGLENIGFFALLLLGVYTFVMPSGLLLDLFFIERERILIALAALLYVYSFFSQGKDCQIKKIRMSSEMILSFVLFALMLIAVLIQRHSASSGLAEREAIGFIMGVVRNGFIWFLVGAVLCYAPFKYNPYVIWIGLLYLFAILAKNVGYDLTVDYEYLIERSGKDDALSHYDVGEYVLLFLFYCYAISPTKYRIYLCLTSVSILYMCGGRSALFIGIFSVFIYELLVRKSFKLSMRMGISAVAFVCGLVMMIWVLQKTGLASEKMFFVGGLDESGSFQDRMLALQVGLQGLGSQFLYGGVTDIVQQFGEHGFYIHNGLSCWQFFGFIPFVIVVILILLAIKVMLRAHKGKLYNSTVLFSITLVFCLLSLIINRYIGTFYLWISLGYWFSYTNLKKSMK
ncbi:hypothetical protein V2O64_15060 [Verrucomicrobiaceae bacterium 227]